MPVDPLQKAFMESLETRGIVVTEKQCALFEQYYCALVSWNKKVNLTGITERSEVYWKHFYDSLTPAFFVDLTACNTLVDVGSGAGFPAFPLKIVFPHLHITVVDSLRKRLNFLEEICRLLALSNVKRVHARAEDLGHNKTHREQYDLVMARAVARLGVLSEYCLPFTHIGGQFIALKGGGVEDEVAEAKRAIALLGGRHKATHVLALPYSFGDRSIVQVVKERRTPKKYPRQAGMPAGRPL